MLSKDANVFFPFLAPDAENAVFGEDDLLSALLTLNLDDEVAMEEEGEEGGAEAAALERREVLQNEGREILEQVS